MRTLEMNRQACQVFYVITIIMIVMCGNYQKHTSQYEEGMEGGAWIQFGNGDVIEQSVNVINDEAYTQTFTLFCMLENTNAGDALDIYLLNPDGSNSPLMTYKFDSSTKFRQNITVDVSEGKRKQGNYILRIIPSISNNSSIYIESTNNGITGSHKLKINGNIQENNLRMKTSYCVYEVDKGKIPFRCFLIVVFIAVLMSAAYLLLMNKTGGYSIFICSFTLTALYIILSCNRLFFESAPFIEDAVTFGSAATSETFIKALCTKDAGYLCLIQNIISWFVFRILHFGKYGYFVMNVIVIAVISAINAFINLPIFETIADRKTRFLVSLAIPIIYVRQYESYAFINFVYWGIILFALTLFLDLEKIKNHYYILLLVSEVLICLSKGIYAIMCPIIIFYVFLLIVQRKAGRKTYAFWIAVELASMTQIVNYLISDSRAVSKNRSLMGIIKQSFLQIGRLCVGTVYDFSPYVNEKFLMIVSLLICIIFAICFICFLKTKDGVYIRVLTLMAVVFCNSLMIGINQYYDQNQVNLYYSRQEFFSLIAFVFLILLCSNYQREIYKIIRFIMFANLIFLSIRMNLKESDLMVHSPNTWAFSISKVDNFEWSIYGNYIEEDAFFVKIFPEYFAFKKNVNVDLFSYYNEVLEVNSNRHTGEAVPTTLIEYRNTEQIFPKSKEQLWGIYFQKSSISYQYIVKAYDDNSQIIASEIQRDPMNAKGCIIKFEEPLSNVSSIKFYDKISGDEISIMPRYACIYTDY